MYSEFVGADSESGINFALNKMSWLCQPELSVMRCDLLVCCFKLLTSPVSGVCSLLAISASKQ